MRPGTGGRTLSEGLGKFTNSKERRWQPRGGGGKRQEGLTLNSSGLRGHATSLPAELDSWILPASGPRLGGSARPERGQGTVSWRTCLAFPSVHSYLGCPFLLCVPLGENYGCLAPHSGRDQMNFKGQGPHILSARQIPPADHSLLIPFSESHP